MSVYGELKGQGNDADGSFLTACSRKQKCISVSGLQHHGLCWLKKDVCVVTAPVFIFKLFFLEKLLCVCPFVPHLPSVPHLSLQGGLKMQCPHIFIF